jgi:CheY-like chemotaxis protein
LNQALHNGTILIADHSTNNLKVLGKRLRDEGYFVLTAMEGRQALTIVENKMPDLVLLEAAIPLQNGFEVCRSIKNLKGRSVPVLLMSDTNDGVAGEKEAKMAGADDFIPGVRDLDELIRRIDKYFPEKQPKTIAKFRNSRPIKALLIEDNELNKDFVSMLLDQMGVEVVPALNGKAALEKFTSENFDIVITDLHVPIMNGMEITKTIRQKYASKVPIIVISGEMDIAVIAQCFEAGVNAHLPKPFQSDQFRKLVARFMPEVEKNIPVKNNTPDKEKEGYDYSSIIELAKGDVELLKKWHSHFMLTLNGATDYINDAIRDNDFSGGKSIFHDLNNYSSYFGTQRLHGYLQELSAVRKISDDKERLGNFYRKIKGELETIQRFYSRDNLFS